MQDRIYARRAKGSPARNAMFKVVMAGNGGREMSGCDSDSFVEEHRSVIDTRQYCFCRLRVSKGHVPESSSSTITSEETVRSCSSPASRTFKESLRDVSPYRARAIPTSPLISKSPSDSSGLLCDARRSIVGGRFLDTSPTKRKVSRLGNERINDASVATVHRGDEITRDSTPFPNSPSDTEPGSS